jgi:hypothetical protein
MGRGHHHDSTERPLTKTTVFWMSPCQKTVYRRHHDIVVHDTTFSANRFDMQLQCFVVVDSAFKSRLVACALTLGGKLADYEWALRQLMVAVNNKAPKAIMVGRDPAMDSACFSILPQTRIINCMWHGRQNLRRMVRPHLVAGWGRFTKEFEVACRPLLPAEFDRRWETLCQTFGDRDVGVITRYLKRLYKDRLQWAWPWVRTSFTASMQSTQRVEKLNHVVKYMGLQSNRHLRKSSR